MYDPQYPYPYDPDPYGQFLELHDPRFWADVVRQTGIAPMRLRQPPYTSPPVVYLPSSQIIDGPVVDLSGSSRGLVPYQQEEAFFGTPQTIYIPSPYPAHRPYSQPRTWAPQKGPGWLVHAALWCAAALILFVLITSVAVPKSAAPATPTSSRSSAKAGKPVGKPDTGYSLYGGPSISGTFIDRVLAHYGSPARGKGQALYDLGVEYGVDPALALAFFMHESSFGTQGEAQTTLALGNLRCIPDYPCVDQARGGYAQFTSWEEGFKAWYVLITGPVYKGAGLTTVDQIIPRYAPSSDNNDEAGYIAAVKHAVDTWRSGEVVVA